MKLNKLKKYTIKFGIVFFIVIGFLTYFSKTIDNMLLPKVKVANIMTGSLSENTDTMHTKYLLPVSSVETIGESGSVFVIFTDDSGDTTVNSVSVNILDSDDLYYEVTSEDLFNDMQIVYNVSKSISDGDRVFVEEE